MVYETDNAESRIGQTQETLTNGDHLVSEAYQGMAASAKQSRIEPPTFPLGQTECAGSGKQHPTNPGKERKTTYE